MIEPDMHFVCHTKLLNAGFTVENGQGGQVVEPGCGHGCPEGGFHIVNSASSTEMRSHTKHLMYLI